eukprot:COSAG02_NODE_1074_length_14765_cov_23.566685_8_plen_84_part_00
MGHDHTVTLILGLPESSYSGTFEGLAPGVKDLVLMLCLGLILPNERRLHYTHMQCTRELGVWQVHDRAPACTPWLAQVPVPSA